MSFVERFRTWYEHERDANAKMLAMLQSVPVERREDPRFQRAVTLAAHLAACRMNWLDRMIGDGNSQTDWWPEAASLESLRPTFAECEAAWTAYFGGLTEANLASDFEFGAPGSRYRWNVEGQLVQLLGHAFYHRGQIALLVDQLGGATEDTDYLFWAFPRDPRYGKIG